MKYAFYINDQLFLKPACPLLTTILNLKKTLIIAGENVKHENKHTNSWLCCCSCFKEMVILYNITVSNMNAFSVSYNVYKFNKSLF